MKFMKFAAMLLLTLLLVSCRNGGEICETSFSTQAINTEINESSTVFTEVTSTPIPTLTPSIIPDLLISGVDAKWYDWEVAGAPPLSNHGFGVMVTSDGESIYYPQRDLNKGQGVLRIFKSDKDGSNKVVLDEYEAREWEEKLDCYVNFFNGWLYYTIDNRLYRIRPDGTEKTAIVSSYSSMDFITIKDQIYVEDDAVLFTCGIDGKLEQFDGIALAGYDNGNLYYFIREGDGPNILCAYNIRQKASKSIYSESDGTLDSFVVYKDIIYSLQRANEIHQYNLISESEKTVSCPEMGEGFNIAVYDHFLLIVSNCGSGWFVFLYDIETGLMNKLCSCPSYISVYSTRCGIYFYQNDTVFKLKSDGQRYSVEPI